MKMRRILICGIGTDVGKTVVAAIVVKALNACYWKPIQSGERDTQKIKELVKEATCYPEAYCLTHPQSPHHAAALESIELEPKAIHLPKPSSPLVIEAIGGVLVPYRFNQLLIDLYLAWDCEWIVVSRHYLGSINHTLLTLEALKRRKVHLKGIIFNGPDQPYSEKAILSCAKIRCLGHLYPESELTGAIIQKYADLWKPQLV